MFKRDEILYAFSAALVVILVYNYVNNPRSFVRRNEGMLDPKKKVIPLKVYQTWSTKKLPMFMHFNREVMKKLNPEFEFELYDDQDCEDFIRWNFDASVLTAYKALVPGAYKADLWRYCILYKKGGIYLDVKMRTVDDFKLIELVSQEHYVQDRPDPFMPFATGIYNAVMVHKPNNPLLMDCINAIVHNVATKDYGFTSLSPTGPALLGKLYHDKHVEYNLDEIDMFHNHHEEVIEFEGRPVLTHYPQYRKEQTLFSKEKHYSTHWKNRTVYK
jgi:mannosyltransferase OCH1-like enzyme